MLTEGHEQRVGPRNLGARQKRGRPGNHRIFMREPQGYLIESPLVHGHLEVPGGWIIMESEKLPHLLNTYRPTPQISETVIGKLERHNQKEREVNFDPLSHIG